MSWKTIVINGIVTGVVTIGTGAALFWVQNKEPKLTYNYVKSISFEDSVDRVFIQQFEIVNSGDKAAEDVYLSVTFPQSIIEKAIVDIDGSIKSTKNIGDNSIVVTAENFNPKEGLNISALVKGKSGQTVEPLISLRAKGIKGEKVGGAQKENVPTMIIALIAAYAGVLAFLVTNKKTSRVIYFIVARLTGRAKFGSGNQREILASLLAMYGFFEKAKEYSVYGSRRKYWVESDILSAEVINADVGVRNRMLLVLKNLLDLISMAPSSESVVLYNIARIHKTLGDGLEVDYLDKSRKLCPEVVKARLEKDPVFQDGSIP